MGVPTSKFNNGTESVSGVPENSSPKKVANVRKNILTNGNNNFVVVWLDTDENNSDIIYQNAIARLERISVLIKVFTNVNECTRFLTKMKDFRILMVVNNALFEEIWSHIRSMTHIHSIYILSNDNKKKEYPDQEYGKVKGVFDKVGSIYSFLKRDTRQFQQDILVMSIIPSINYSKKDLKEVNQLFIYWFLVKQIILDMKYDKEAHKRLAEFCRTHYIENNTELQTIDEYEKSYHDHSPIWWYTRQCFINVMLNRALQSQDIEVIIKMAPFIRDLHRQLEQLKRAHEISIVLYRTQQVSNIDLERIKKNKGALLSFNNFILLNPDYQASLDEARRALAYANVIGLLFRIEVGSAPASTPFASLMNLTNSPEREKCFLFSMHSVFRINEVKEIEDQVWEISLNLMETNDKQMACLSELIREETRDVRGWHKLAKLMSSLRDFDHAKEIYFALLDLLTENDSLKMSYIYNELGLICDETGEYQSALSYYQKSIKLRQKSSPENHRSLSAAYNNIGEVQREIGNYFGALSFHQKTLDMKQKTLPPDDLSLATTHNNLGLANESLGEYSKALEHYNKALDIKLKTLPPIHRDLAVVYNNIGEAQREMGNYSAALQYFQKVLRIRLKNGSSRDSSLAITYNNIGLIHREKGDYAQAMSYFQKSLEIKQQTFTTHHPSLAITYNNMGDISQLMGEFSQAFAFYQKALDIQEKFFHENHPDLATTYNNIGATHQIMGDYSKALSFYERALKIRQNSLPPTHPTIATSYNNIGHLKQTVGDYKAALEHFEKTLQLQEASLRPYHPSIAVTYNNIGDAHRNLGDHKAALTTYTKSLEVKEKAFPPNHPSLPTSYNNIGVLHQTMNDYSSALKYYKKTLELQKKALPSNHPDLAAIYNNIGVAHQSLEDYATALENYEQALKIYREVLPINHSNVATVHNSIATAYVGIGDLHKAIEHEQCAIDIASQSLSPNHPNLKTFLNYLERMKTRIEAIEKE